MVLNAFLDRSHARRVQTDAEFSKFIARETNLPIDDAREATLSLLETLFQRITPGAAKDLASQLPLNWKNSLESSMNGPNRDITAEEMIENIAQAITRYRMEALRVAHEICDALEDLTSGRTMEHLMDQLPTEFQDVLSGRR